MIVLISKLYTIIADIYPKNISEVSWNIWNRISTKICILRCSPPPDPPVPHAAPWLTEGLDIASQRRYAAALLAVQNPPGKRSWVNHHLIRPIGKCENLPSVEKGW